MTDILSLTEATKAVPKLDGKRPVPSTIFRWAREGILRNGIRVRLRYTKIGKRIGIPADALPEFFKALADADAITPDEPQLVPERGTRRQATTDGSVKQRTPKLRERDIERNARELRAAGYAVET